MMSGQGKIIIIVAPSGTGKSTLLKMAFKDFPELNWSISTTTRPMREGETNGKDYHFTTVEKFKADLAAGNFVEWAEVHGNYYGVSKKEIEKAIDEGKVIVCDIDVQGADTMLKAFPAAAKAIFIEPPSVSELQNRLRKRATDASGVIELRIQNAIKEMERKNDYHYCVKNDDLEKGYARLKAVLKEILQDA